MRTSATGSQGATSEEKKRSRLYLRYRKLVHLRTFFPSSFLLSDLKAGKILSLSEFPMHGQNFPLTAGPK